MIAIISNKKLNWYTSEPHSSFVLQTVKIQESTDQREGLMFFTTDQKFEWVEVPIEDREAMMVIKPTGFIKKDEPKFRTKEELDALFVHFGIDIVTEIDGVPQSFFDQRKNLLRAGILLTMKMAPSYGSQPQDWEILPENTIINPYI